MSDRFWVGGTGTWSDTAHWSTTSGGTSGAAAPTSSDDAYFDANSFSGAGQVVTVAASTECRSMDWNGATNTPGLTINSNMVIVMHGSCRLISAMTPVAGNGNSGLRFGSQTTGWTVDLGGLTIPWGVTFGVDLTGAVGGGGWTLLSAITSTNTTASLIVGGGTVDFGTFNYSFSTGIIQFSASGTIVTTVRLNGSTITTARSAANTILISNAVGTSPIFESNTATFVLTGASPTVSSPTTVVTSAIDMGGASLTWQPSGAGTLTYLATNRAPMTWRNFNVHGHAGGSTVSMLKNSTFTTMNSLLNAITVNVTAGVTITVARQNGFFSGASGAVVTLQSTVSGTAWNVTSAYRQVCDYLSLKDSAAAQALAWYAGEHSTNVSGNTNWIFAVPNPGVCYPSVEPEAYVYHSLEKVA